MKWCGVDRESPLPKLISITLLICSFLPFLGRCGKPTVTWQKVLDTGTDDQLAAVLTRGDEVIVAFTQGNQQQGRTVWFVQTLDRKGNFVRRQPFAEGSVNICRAAALDRAGNLLLAGYARFYDTTFALIVKVTPQGKTLWKKGIFSGNACWANGVAALDSNIVFCGGVQTAAGPEVYLALLNPDGKTVWTRNYQFDQGADAVALAVHPDGNLTVLCRVASCSGQDILLMHTKPNGDTLWTRRYDSGGNDIPAAVGVDRFGNIVGLGTARTEDSTRCVVLEYTPDGGAVRKVAYGVTAQAEAGGLVITEKGEIFISGTLITPRRRKLLVFEYQPNATSVWERHIDPGFDVQNAAIGFDRDLFVAVDGTRQTKDIMVLRLDRPAAPR